MRKHRTVKIIGIAIIVAALVYLVLGVIGAISLGGSGLGEGWSSGWRGWLTIPILAATLLGFVALLVFGALLYFLAKIDNNLAEAQQRMAEAAAKAAAKPAEVSAPAAVATSVVTAEQAEPVVEVTAPEGAAPVIATAAVVGVAAAARHEDAVEAEVAAPAESQHRRSQHRRSQQPRWLPASPPNNTKMLWKPRPSRRRLKSKRPPSQPRRWPSSRSSMKRQSTSPCRRSRSPQPAVEVAAPAVAAAAAPAVDDTEALRVQIAALQAQLAALDSSAEPAAPEAPARLPGTEEAARIAAEMAALKPPKS